MKYLRRFLFSWALVLTFCGQAATAIDTMDVPTVSVLTCSPGKAAYELYGHTALRVKTKTQDWVFNYGVFDFRTPHFVWRFMLGQTDYLLRAAPFEYFVKEYARHGRGIDEQVLNLRPEEAVRIAATVDGRERDRDWTYRYNFLYDNCTTRAIGDVEQGVDGRIVWDETVKPTTFRRIIAEFSAEVSPWNRFGQDLILGAETDAPIGRKEQMFAPLYAERFLDSARIVDRNGRERPAVLEKRTLVSPQGSVSDAHGLTPMTTAWLLVAFTLLLTGMERMTGRQTNWWDNLCLLVLGLTGCIVALLFFFSGHPAVGSNWLVLFVNPLPLVYLPVKMWRNVKKRPDHYAALVLTALVLFAGTALWGCQHYPAELYVVALVFAVRAAARWMFLRNKISGDSSYRRSFLP